MKLVKLSLRFVCAGLQSESPIKNVFLYSRRRPRIWKALKGIKAISGFTSHKAAEPLLTQQSPGSQLTGNSSGLNTLKTCLVVASNPPPPPPILYYVVSPQLWTGSLQGSNRSGLTFAGKADCPLGSDEEQPAVQQVLPLARSSHKSLGWGNR